MFKEPSLDHNNTIGQQPENLDASPYSLDKQATASRINLQGVLSIAQSEAVKELFVEALQRRQPIELNMGGLRKVDFAILQLFFSLNISAESASVPLAIKSLSESVSEIIRSSGFMGERYQPLAV